MAPEIIQFSQKVIVFPATEPFNLQISNKSQTHALLFKIKTTKLNTYQVKPPLGSIQPGEKKNIQFKLVKPLSDQQLRQAKNKDKFQFQFLTINPNDIPKGKPEFKTIWDQFKGTSEKSNVVNYTFPIMMESQAAIYKTAGDQPFSPIKTKNSLSKSDFKNTSIRKGLTLQSDLKKDEELSKQFQNLKEKQHQLMEQRQKIFKSQPKITENEKKSGVQIALIIIAFLLSIVIGNFLKLRVFVGQQL